MTHARQPVPGRRPAGPGRAGRTALALQQAVGNRALGRTLARKVEVPTRSVQIGKLKVAVSGGNIADWAAGKVPDTLDLISQKGKHSAELERLSKDRAKIPTLTLTVPIGGGEGEDLDLGSYVIEITNARITSYALDDKTETWQIGGFDGVHRTKISRKIGAG